MCVLCSFKDGDSLVPIRDSLVDFLLFSDSICQVQIKLWFLSALFASLHVRYYLINWKNLTNPAGSRPSIYNHSHQAGFGFRLRRFGTCLLAALEPKTEYVTLQQSASAHPKCTISFGSVAIQSHCSQRRPFSLFSHSALHFGTGIMPVAGAFGYHRCTHTLRSRFQTPSISLPLRSFALFARSFTAVNKETSWNTPWIHNKEVVFLVRSSLSSAPHRCLIPRPPFAALALLCW